LTEEPAEEAPRPAGGDLRGPPGGRIFSLEGRRAPSLYLIAWVLSVGGLALLFVGIGAAPGLGRTVLILSGAIALGLGLLFGAGYQLVERRDRHPERYRGPAPLLTFGIVLAGTTLLSSVLVSTGLLDPDAPFDFLVVLVASALAYAVIVWLLVVHTGALSWREMGWPTGGPGAARRILRDAGPAIAVMLPTTVGILLLGGLLGRLLDVTAPEVLPTPNTSFEALAVALAAAVVAPVGEELFFRGFALTAWLRDLGWRAALGRSALFFAIVHIGNLPPTPQPWQMQAAQAFLQFAVILPVGLVLGWLFVRHGMVGAIAGHVTYNTFLLLLILVASLAGVPVPT
jgi:membrane protease YdiL (CAAX protease family)